MPNDNQNDDKPQQDFSQGEVAPITEVEDTSSPISQDVVSQTSPNPVQDSSFAQPQTQNSTGSDSQPVSSPPGDPTQTIVTAPHAPKKYGGRKVIATIFGILLLIGGVTAGVILVQRQQQIAEEAASGKECQQAEGKCILKDEPGNSGSFTAPKTISHVFITAKDFHKFEPGQSDNGCYKVTIEGAYLSWEKYGSGPDCKDVSNIQIWLKESEPSPTLTPVPSETLTPSPTGKLSPTPKVTTTPSPIPTLPPTVSAKCLDVKAYNAQWKLLTQEELNDLNSGDKVRFAVAGQASSGNFTKARFTVNGTSLGETTQKKSGTEEFYIEYTVPTGTTTFTVKGEVFHSELGWI